MGWTHMVTRPTMALLVYSLVTSVVFHLWLMLTQIKLLTYPKNHPNDADPSTNGRSVQAAPFWFGISTSALALRSSRTKEPRPNAAAAILRVFSPFRGQEIHRYLWSKLPGTGMMAKHLTSMGNVIIMYHSDLDIRVLRVLYSLI